MQNQLNKPTLKHCHWWSCVNSIIKIKHMFAAAQCCNITQVHQTLSAAQQNLTFFDAQWAAAAWLKKTIPSARTFGVSHDDIEACFVNNSRMMHNATHLLCTTWDIITRNTFQALLWQSRCADNLQTHSACTGSSRLAHETLWRAYGIATTHACSLLQSDLRSGSMRPMQCCAALKYNCHGINQQMHSTKLTANISSVGYQRVIILDNQSLSLFQWRIKWQWNLYDGILQLKMH